jgi:hypothetical protein
MTWASGGLLLDLLRVVGLIPLDVDVPGMVTRGLALAASVLLAHLTLFRPPQRSDGRIPNWFGWAAFVLALPYPLLMTWWALGGTLGLTGAGVAGDNWKSLVVAAEHPFSAGSRPIPAAGTHLAPWSHVGCCSPPAGWPPPPPPRSAGQPAGRW